MMKLIKLAVISFVLLFGLLTLMSLLLPSSVRISRAIDIDVVPDSVRLYVQDLTQWKQWNAMVHDTLLTNPAYTANAITATEVAIRLLTADSAGIHTDWHRGDRRVNSTVVLIPSGNHRTIVQWYFDIKLKWYPWEKFSSIVFDKQMGPLMEQSLSSLKTLAEKPF